MCTVQTDNNSTSYIEENKKNISALHILLIIILITVDYFSMFNYGIELKSFKYLVNYQELLVINGSIIVIFSLLSIISRKTPYLFFVNAAFLLTIIVFTFDEIKGFWDSLTESFGQAFILALVISIILYGPSKLYKFILDMLEGISYWIIPVSLIFSSLITFGIYNHYDSLNYNWNKIYVKNDNYFFNKYTTWQTLFRQKIFSTNRLEELQNNIEFKYSNYYVDKLKNEKLVETNILENNKDLLFSNYILNGDYKTLFIVRKVKRIKSIFQDNAKKQEKTMMYIIFTKKDNFKEEYQIIDLIKKPIIIEYIEKG